MEQLTNQTKEVRQVLLRDLKWKNHGAFSVHYEPDTAHIISHVKRIITREEIGAITRPDELNRHQQFLYDRALKGFEVYSGCELAQMHWSARQKITENYKRAWRVINLFKQAIMNLVFEGFLKQFWEDMDKFTARGKNEHNVMLDYRPEPDPEFRCRLSNNELGITRKHIVDLLICERILPEDFYELSSQGNRSKPVEVKLVDNKPEALD